MFVLRRAGWAVVVVVALATAGCDTLLGLPTTDVPPGTNIPPGAEVPQPITRIPRLTRLQWENAVRDLLRLDERTGFSSELSQDALPAGYLFDNPADTLSVDGTQWSGFQRAASRVAELVTTDAAALARLLPPDTGDEDARARAFVEDFVSRAHRRPASSADVDRYLVVYQAGRSGFANVDPFTGGVRLVIEAALQSPFFLYRIEQSTQVSGGVVPLDGYEVASRLSFALWNSMPDDTLFSAAEDGSLEDPATVEAEARRILDDPRATETLLHFHDQLLEAEKLNNVHPSEAFFPDAPVDLGALAKRENDAFLSDLFTTNGGFEGMLLSSKTFVNADLAALYRLDGSFGDELVEVELDPALRKGIFTHIAFLAQNATGVDPDPIHRGVFLAKNIACIPIAAPPANVPPLPPPEPDQTNRDRVAAHTEAGSPCADCHRAIINPFGYPFEGYDAIGQVRADDNGLPLDTSSTVLVNGFTEVRNAVELTEALASSPDVHNCYARHWVEMSMGRSKVDGDDTLIQRIGTASKDGASLKELLVGIVTSPAFLARAQDGGGA